MKNNQKFYEVNVKKHLDKTSSEPYRFTVNIQYTDEAFQAHMKNVLEATPIRLQIKRTFSESLRTEILQGFNGRRKFLETFGFECEEYTNTFSYGICQDGVRDISLVEQVVQEFLQKESKAYESLN